MLIQRVIVEDMRRVCVLNNPLSTPVTEQDLRDAFKGNKLFILNLTVDTVGTAIVTVADRLPLSSWRP